MIGQGVEQVVHIFALVRGSVEATIRVRNCQGGNRATKPVYAGTYHHMLELVRLQLRTSPHDALVFVVPVHHIS